ncbi:MAG TPA: ABC transporter ATP-binding protein [Pseudonocardia sp.]|nr:ABC transporter ATP-binding protein [Pseudonocardia sp.]
MPTNGTGSTRSGSNGSGAAEDPLAPQGGATSVALDKADGAASGNGRPTGVVLEVDDLTVGFPGDDGLVQAVRGVSYQLHYGEVLGIVGESGSGKSVTSLAVMGLLPRTAQFSGSVKFRGEELLGGSDAQLNKVRGRSISMIFQDPMTSLNPVYTVGYQVTEAVLAHQDVSKAQARERAAELLEIVRIPNPRQRLDNYPHELSGGMRQRVVIAIAMANDPDVIIADEPTTALDVTVQAQIMEALRAAQRATGAAMVLITHDLGVIAGQADRVAVMYAGKLVEIGTAEDVFYTARMPYTFGLLGSLPRLDRPSERLTPIGGAPPSVVNMPPGCPFTPRCPLAVQVCEDVEPELEPTTGPDHLAACHRSAELIGRTPGDVFETAVVDTSALAHVVEATAEDGKQS